MKHSSAKLKKTILSNIKHDLTNPINAILGYSELLLDIIDLDFDILRNDIKTIHDSGHLILSNIKKIFSQDALENINNRYVNIETLTVADLNLVWRMIRSHKFHTGSPLGNIILDEWETKSKERFVKVVPKAMENVDVDHIYNQQISMRMGETENKIEGLKFIDTPLGKFEAIKVSRVRSRSEHRKQIFWLVPSLDYTIAQIVNDDGKRLVTIKLKELGS